MEASQSRESGASFPETISSLSFLLLEFLLLQYVTSEHQVYINRFISDRIERFELRLKIM